MRAPRSKTSHMTNQQWLSASCFRAPAPLSDVERKRPAAQFLCSRDKHENSVLFSRRGRCSMAAWAAGAGSIVASRASQSSPPAKLSSRVQPCSSIQYRIDQTRRLVLPHTAQAATWRHSPQPARQVYQALHICTVNLGTTYLHYKSWHLKPSLL